MTQYQQIQEWILNQINHPTPKLSLQNLLFVAGNSGIGKTYNIHKICNELNLDIMHVSTNNCMSSDELNDIITKYITSNMLQILCNNFRKKIIIIDEFESIMAIDRTINTCLLNILTNTKLKSVPIICISSLDIVKKIGVIKKKCKIIEIENPSFHEVCRILNKIYPHIDKDIIKTTAEACDGNLSHCIQRLDNNISYCMDEDTRIHALYSKNFDRDLIKKVVLTDIWLIPLRFHENLIAVLKQHKCTNIQRNEYYKTFMQNLLYFDFITTSSSDIASDIFASMIYFLSNLSAKKNAKFNTEGFTKILSYLSLQKKFIKKSHANNTSNFPLYQISNYHTHISGRNFYVL
jgi:chromosomal replication initiation ATPase DnaA